LQSVAVLLSVLGLTSSVHAEGSLAVPVEGDAFPARLTSITAEGQLGFDAAGKPRSLAAADLVAWGQPAELQKGPIILLADGGRLPASVAGADKVHLTVDSTRLGRLKLPLESLAGVVYRPPPNPAELDALLDRVAGGQGRADRLILDNGDEVAGVIEELESDKLKIKGDLGTSELGIRRLVAVIFNPVLRQPPAAQPRAAWIGLRDGARLPVAALVLQGEALELTTLSGAKWTAAAKDLVHLMPQTARAVYLSDIPADDYRFLPYLQTQWPYRTDRNVTGGQLRSGGRLCLKGLGMHSAARLSYALDRPWSRFQAEVGIDDSTAGRGSVSVRVFVDGKLQYASPPIRGGMRPQAVSVALSGAKRLDLVVDYGEGGDVMDRADWLDARLVR
jgi:hypothetical protein